MNKNLCCENPQEKIQPSGFKNNGRVNWCTCNNPYCFNKVHGIDESSLGHSEPIKDKIINCGNGLYVKEFYLPKLLINFDEVDFQIVEFVYAGKNYAFRAEDFRHILKTSCQEKP